MQISEAKEIEELLFSDCLLMGDDFIAMTHTFKDSKMRRRDYSPERTRAVGHNIRQACQHKDFRIRLNKVSFLIKDEFQNSNGHCHSIIWLDELRKQKKSINYFVNVLHGYWSAPFESYKDSSWSNLKECVTEPKTGWLKSNLAKKDSAYNLMRYQTKFAKNDKVVGLNFHASCALVKKLNSMDNHLHILQRN